MASLKWGGWEGSKGLGGGGVGAVQWLGWPWQVVSELEVETQQEQGHGRKEGETKHLTEMPDCGKEHREGKSALLKLSHHHGVLESSNLSIMNSILDSYNDRPVSFCGCWQARIRRRGDLSSGGHTPGRPTLTSPHRTHFSHPPTFFPSTPCLPRLSPAQRLASTTLNECFFQQWDFSSWLTWWKLYELTLWEKRTKWSQCVCVSVCVCMWMFVGAEVAAATKSCWKLYYKLRDIRSNKSLMCLPQGSRKQVWLSGRIGHTHNSSANGQGPCSP